MTEEKNLRRGITQGQGYLEMMEEWVERRKDIEAALGIISLWARGLGNPWVS